MKIILEKTHPTCKITVYSWNNKFIFKFETQYFEQTYKVAQTELTGEESVNEIISEKFLQKVLERFKQMDYDWDELVGDDF